MRVGRESIRLLRLLLILCLAWAVRPDTAHAEDGHDLWLRYRPLPTARAAALARHARYVAVAGDAAADERVASAVAELERGLGGLTGRVVRRDDGADAGGVILAIGARGVAAPFRAALAGLGQEGYLIR